VKKITFDEYLKSRNISAESVVEQMRESALSILPLAALREHAGLTQSQMASRLKKSQAAISKFEGRGDFLLSTIYKYVVAMGGSIDLKITVSGHVFDLEINEDAGDIFFRLIPLHETSIGKGMSIPAVGAFKRRLELVGGSAKPNLTLADWNALKSGKGYNRSEQELLNILAANDESESIAA